jgi:hypothetical protein
MIQNNDDAAAQHPHGTHYLWRETEAYFLTGRNTAFKREVFVRNGFMSKP